MSPVVAVGAGSQAVARIVDACSANGAWPGMAITRHGRLAVAWSAANPWVTTHDDGDVLVVVDGRLHLPRPRDGSPARTVLCAYRRDGLRFAHGMLGDFVAVVLVRSTGRLLVARDPLGVRPWHHAPLADGHVGASDVGSLVAMPGVDTRVNEAMAVEYLGALWRSRGETLYEGIRSLPPGSTWTSDADSMATFRHHAWAVEPDARLGWAEAAERCRATLDAALADRLASPFPATAELSGGLDSSVVVGSAVGLGAEDLAVGRLVFDTPRADERAYSDAVISRWRLPAVSAPPWLPDPEAAAALTARTRLPLQAPHFTMFMEMHRLLAEEGRSEVVTGLGGDDAFVGVDNGSRVVSAFQLRQTTVLAQLARWSVRHPRLAWGEVVRPLAGYFAPRRRAVWPGWLRRSGPHAERLRHALHAPPERLTGVAAIDARLDNVTSGYDAAILEERAVLADLQGHRDTHPFLDPRVVEATYGLDPWFATRGGHTRALQVAAYRDRLPDVVASRRSKADFSEVFWPLIDGRAVARARSGPLLAHGWLDPAGFDDLARQAEEGRAWVAIPLFRCLALDAWLRAEQ